MALIPYEFINTVAAIGAVQGEKIIWIGTGFFFGIKSEELIGERYGYNVYFVTNKHVFEGHQNVLLRFNPTNSDTGKDFPLVLIDQNGQRVWHGHPDSDVDVAVLSVNFNYLKEQNVICSFFENDTHGLGKDEMIEQGLFEGDNVYVLGFPMGLVTERKYVLVRSGIISRISDLYENSSKEFIIDAPVFPGNSGGPVLCKPELIAIQGTKAIEKCSLIGLVKSYIPYRDVAISQQTGNTRVVFEENSGLTVVEPVDHIVQAIESMNKIMPRIN
jgi:S1-C subfamily serine protease